MVQLRDDAAGDYPLLSPWIGWSAGDAALDDADDGRRPRRGMLDPEFEINGCYLLPHEEGAARCSAGLDRRTARS